MAKSIGKKKPLLDFSVEETKELKATVKLSVFEMIAKYVAYVKQTAKQKADDNSVVERGLEYFFKKDGGFQEFLKNGGAAKPDVSQTPRPAAAGAES